MKKIFILLLIISILMTFFSTAMFALNPFVSHIYTADPSGHVFENRMYVYPSHDKDTNPGFFGMEDYHVFSSADMINWVDHGVALKKEDVKWAKYHFWAPDCAYKNGKYYFYFPACIRPLNVNDKNSGKNNFYIGVAIGNSPSGPFVPLDNYMKDSFSIDPAIFIDDDGAAYMFFGGKNHGGLEYNQGCYWAKLKPNMIEFESKPTELPVKYFFEGPWVHKRNGIYYFSCSDGDMQDPGNKDQNKISNIVYSICKSSEDFKSGKNWEFMGNIMNASEKGGCWTNHHSIVEYKGDWYFFYQNSKLSSGVQSDPNKYDGFRRSICLERLYYNGEKINQITATPHGLGTSAYSRIKAILFSGEMTKSGKEKIISEDAGGGDIGKNVGWLQDGDCIFFNDVDFGSISAIAFEAEVATDTGGHIIEIHIDAKDGTLIGDFTVDDTNGWHNWVVKSNNLYNNVMGKKNIYLVFKKKKGSSDQYLFNINWFKFTYNEPVFPIGLPIALKSKNPESIDNNEYLVNDNFNKGSEGQKYLCADRYQGYDLCANRASVGKENKFTILTTNLNIDGDRRNGYIQFNSSSNGQNLKIIDREFKTIINAMGSDYKTTTVPECFYLTKNDDNTILLQNLENGKYAFVNTWKESKDPARVFCDSDSKNGDWERFYCEVSDAPIGCTVAFKTLDYFKKRDGDNDYINSELGQMYLCADTWNREDGGVLSADRSELGKDNELGEWEKFLVVDAKNGYIALKSFNHHVSDQYLRFDNNDKQGKVNGGSTVDNNLERFQWINNGDGTISLRNVGLNQILSVVNTDANGNIIYPAMVYANKSKVSNEPNSREKFYCQIVAPVKN